MDWRLVVQFGPKPEEWNHMQILGIVVGIVFGYFFIAGWFFHMFHTKLQWDRGDSQVAGCFWPFTGPFNIPALLAKSNLPKAKVIK